MKIGFEDTEGRRHREDGRRVVYIWPFTDFDGHRLNLATTRHLAWQWYFIRPKRWARWYVADAWDPHGARRFDMSSATRPWWWAGLWPVAGLGRWVHRHCLRCGRTRLAEPEEEEADEEV